MIRRVLVGIIIFILAIGQVCLLTPDNVMADSDKPGDIFTIRVGYFGDDNEYRTKLKLTKAQMEALPAQLNYYTNMTSVGTIMSTVGEGPTLKTILDRAGIDIGSVRMLHIRTVDANSKVNNWFMDFPASKYINSSLYYYPNLVKNWERTGDGSGIPKVGALKDGKTVETIIAVKSFSTKSSTEASNINPSWMNTEDSYRLCAGQAKITEMEETHEVSSSESAKWIFGLDVTLWGSPSEAKDLNLKIDDPSIKIGSSKKIVATIIAQDLFEDKLDKTLKWSSSNEEIATVNQEGVVNVKKEGRVKITAETKNGIKKSIIINGTDGAEDDKREISGINNNSDSKAGNGSIKGKNVNKKTINGITAIEVALGNKIEDGVYEARPEMSKDAVELPKQEADPKTMLYAGIVAILIFTLGITLRIKRFRKEV